MVGWVAYQFVGGTGRALGYLDASLTYESSGMGPRRHPTIEQIVCHWAISIDSDP